MRTLPEYNPDTSVLPALLALAGLVAAVLLIVLSSGCASTTLYRSDGQKLAVFQGDMAQVSFTASADGSIRWTADTVDHSAATSASAERIKLTGAAVTASGITTLLMK